MSNIMKNKTRNNAVIADIMENGRFKCKTCGTRRSYSNGFNSDCCNTDNITDLLIAGLLADIKFTPKDRDQYKTGSAHAAANVKQLLKHYYPDYKFSVTSDSYSTGDSVTISWTDGPTYDEINTLAKLFQTYSGMDQGDCPYPGHYNSIMAALGNTKYIYAYRKISDDVAMKSLLAILDFYKIDRVNVDKILQGKSVKSGILMGVKMEDYAPERFGKHFDMNVFHKNLIGNTCFPASGLFEYILELPAYLTNGGLNRGEWHLPIKDLTPSPTGKANKVILSDIAGYDIEKRYHTKKGVDFWVAVPQSRTDKDGYLQLLEVCKSLGGWYCRAWQGDKGGFAFMEEDKALAFVGLVTTGEGDYVTVYSNEGKPATPRPALVRTVDLEKFEEIAGGLLKESESMLRDRTENTLRQRKQAENARQDGYHLAEAGQAVAGLLAAIRDGYEVPDDLRVMSKALAKRLTEPELGRGAGYYDPCFRTGEYKDNSETAVLFRSFINPNVNKIKSEIEAKKKKADLKNLNIPGYFRTPDRIADLVVDLAGITSDSVVLDPSCGDGSLLSAVKRVCSNPRQLTGIEQNHTLWEIAVADHAFVTLGNCLDFGVHTVERPDKIIMNPPFENGQDMDHVLFMFNRVLKNGGRLVAIMSPHWTFAKDKASEQFRDFVEQQGGEWELLPEGSFKESGTGVNCGILVLDN